MCVHTLTPIENRVLNISKNSEKSQYLMNTLYNHIYLSKYLSVCLVFRGVSGRDSQLRGQESQGPQDHTLRLQPLLQQHLQGRLVDRQVDC